MNSSWVAMEIHRAKRRERHEGKRVLFPIRLCSFKDLESWRLIDPEDRTDLAAEFRAFYVPEFSNWKNHDSFEEGFKRLLRDLRSEAATASADST